MKMLMGFSCYCRATHPLSIYLSNCLSIGPLLTPSLLSKLTESLNWIKFVSGRVAFSGPGMLPALYGSQNKYWMCVVVHNPTQKHRRTHTTNVYVCWSCANICKTCSSSCWQGRLQNKFTKQNVFIGFNLFIPTQGQRGKGQRARVLVCFGYT